MAFAEFNQTVTGTRLGAGSYVNGVWTPSVPVALSIESSVQPASENQLLLLPEGRRTDGAYALRSESEIREKDVFSIYGNDHEVLRVQVWQNSIIPHWLGIAVRMHT